MKNKNRFIYLFLLIATYFSVSGQEDNNIKLIKTADSLEQYLKVDQSLVIWEKLIKKQKELNYNYYTGRYHYAKGLNAGHNNGNFEEAIVEFNKASIFFLKCKQDKNIKKWLSNTYLQASYCYWDWDKALEYNIKGYEYTLKNLSNDINIISFLTDQGDIYRNTNNHEQSILSLEKALKKIGIIAPKGYEQLGYVHNLLGISYSNLHFHTQSLYHYSKGLEFHLKSETTDRAYVVNSMTNVIWENIGYGNEEKAREILVLLNKNFYEWYHHIDFATTDAGSVKDRNLQFKALYYLSNLRINVLDRKGNTAKKYLDSIALTFEKYPVERKKLENALIVGRYNYSKLFETVSKNDKENVQAHIDFNKKTLEITRLDQSETEELAACLYLASAYYKYEKYEEALKVVEESKKIAENYFNASRFSIEVLEAKILISLNRVGQAKKTLLNSYQKLLIKQIKIANLKKLKYSDLKKFNSGFFISNTINSAKAFESIYEKTKNKEDLLIANNLYFLASDMFAEFYRKGKYNHSLNNFNQSIASGLLQTQLLIDPNDQKKLKEIINRIENNSSQHLWNIFEVKNKQNLKVPSKLIRHLNEVVFEKNSLKEQIENSKETSELKNQLAIVEKEITKTQTAINQIDPSFQKFKSADFSIDATQKKLLANQLVLKYVVTDDKVFAFSIQKETITLVSLGNKEDLRKVVNDYNKQIRTIDNSFPKNASYLYDKLIQPLLKTKSISTIVFIPEDFLATVSFESLKDKKGQLVVQNFRTSYAYSIKLWNILKEKSNVSKQMETIATFAPNYSKLPPENLKRGGLLRAGLYDLADAKKEARVISELFNGKLYENQDANRDNFLKSTTNYSLHHLAMHSQLEQEYSKSALVFANNKKVYFDELYEINFPSNLVVLSACNTGIGTKENGEGLMSLSRALTYSGVKSSVYSLWQVPDKETSEIMISFYENLKKGQAKDEALANSKKDFIKNNPMKTQPFYWAGFVVNGDVSPIMSSNNWLIYIGIGLGILILVVVFWKKKHFNSINTF